MNAQVRTMDELNERILAMMEEIDSEHVLKKPVLVAKDITVELWDKYLTRDGDQAHNPKFMTRDDDGDLFIIELPLSPQHEFMDKSILGQLFD
jgi:hypothetical protein